MDNEFLLSDRIQKIQQVVSKYGEENFYISFSGGKDSTVLSSIVDMALPNNTIPRVFADTGIELNIIRDFVYELAGVDKRIEIIEPTVPIKTMLESEGYPFKSKQHSKWLESYQRKGMYEAIENYLGIGEKKLYRPCPNKLKYQFSDSFKLKVSDKCCTRMKEDALNNWKAENKKKYGILGLMREEGGRRMYAQCLLIKNDRLYNFQPMVVLTKDFEDWFITSYKIKICDVYKPPYNFPRTGCKGCPFALHLQEELDTLEKYFPNERKQCEIIWKPVYDEYRRIGYRLKKNKSVKKLF